MKLDSKQSHYVLQALLSRRKVRARHVREILRDREREIVALRRRLAALEALGGGSAAKVGRAPASREKRSRKLSPKVRALRRQQGRYMGFVRRLKASEKARVRALREKRGLAAAIRLAASLRRA